MKYKFNNQISYNILYTSLLFAVSKLTGYTAKLAQEKRCYNLFLLQSIKNIVAIL